MIQLGVNKKIYPGYGGDHDIHMSLNDYKDMLYCLKDENITDAGAVRFRNLYACNMYAQLNVLLLSAVPAYIGTKLLFWGVARQHAGYKFLFGPFCLLYMVQSYRNGFKQVPRRLYTEIFTDEGQDGRYVRLELRESTPKLWAFVSKQLYDLGYRFEEMNEVSMEVPTTLLG